MNLMLTLAVCNLEQTAVFYREILQQDLEHFSPAPGHPPLLILRRGDAAILFRQTADLESSHPALFQNLERHPRGVGLLLELSVPRLAPIRRQIDRHGLHLLYELEDDEFHRHELWLHDPDGYLVALCAEGAD